jgi:sulfoxide reductase heme-binding subunit YedZ
VVVGLQVHMRGKMWEYFVGPLKGLMLPRIDAFGAANYTGMAATLIMLALLATSNDVSLRRLGAKRWRQVHGLASWALALTLLHGALYQLLEKRGWVFVVILLVLSLGVAWPRLTRTRDPKADLA